MSDPRAAHPAALVTGASRGIGRAIAVRLAADFDILAAARNRAELDHLVSEIETMGGRAEALVLDVADRSAVERTLAGRDVDVLVNNAGTGPLRPMLELTPDEWHRMIDVNLNALYHVTRAVLPAMLARGRGHVVNIGSIAGRSAFVGGTAYAATKHAVMAFSECLMLEVRDRGVKVSVVNPGSVATHFSERADPSWMLAADEVAESVAHVVMTPPDVLIHRLEIRALAPRKK